MKEKIYVIVLCFIIGSAIFTYDQYVVGQGGIGPIGKTMRLFGLDSGTEDSKVIQRGLELTFDYQVRDMYLKLQKKLEQVNGQRKRLVEERKQLVRRLMDIHDLMLEGSETYTQQIYKQREPYLRYNNEIAQLTRDLIETHKLSDSDLRLKRYKVLEEQLRGMIDKSVQYSKEDVGRLKNIMYSIEQIVMQTDEFFIDGCDTYDQCLMKRKSEIDLQLTRIFEPALKSVGRQIEKYNELLELSEYEYLLEFDNIEARDKFNKVSDEKIHALVQRIMNQLIRITPNDLQDLIYVYKDVAIQYNKQLRNLKEQHERWQKNTNWNRSQLQEITRELGKSEELDFKELVRKYEELDNEYLEIIKEINVNSEQLMQVIDHKTFENQGFLFEVSKIMNIDINRLVKDSAYAQGMNQTYLIMRRRMKQAKR